MRDEHFARISPILTYRCLAPVIPIRACCWAAFPVISFHFSVFSTKWSKTFLFSGWLHRKALSLESFPSLLFPPFFFDFHCSVRGPLPGDLRVYDASVIIVSCRACLPDNAVFMKADWPHMSTKHWRSHVRNCRVVNALCMNDILKRMQDKGKER